MRFLLAGVVTLFGASPAAAQEAASLTPVVEGGDFRVYAAGGRPSG